MAKSKGIILESHDQWAIILNNKGQYKKIKTARPMQVGELWYDTSAPVKKFAAAAAIVLMLLGVWVEFFSVVAYAQVSSGVKIGVNRWDRVVKVEASNAQTEEYIEKAKLKGKKIDEAVEQVVHDTIPGKSNITNHSKPVVTVTSTKKNETNRQRLIRELNKKVQPITKKTNSGKVFNAQNQAIYNKVPAVKRSVQNPFSVKSKSWNQPVKTNQVPNNWNTPPVSVYNSRTYQFWGIQPIQAQDKERVLPEKVQTEQDKKPNFIPVKNNETEKFPATINKKHDRTMNSPRMDMQSKEYRSPKVHKNKQTNGSDQREKYNKDKSR